MAETKLQKLKRIFGNDVTNLISFSLQNYSVDGTSEQCLTTITTIRDKYTSNGVTLPNTNHTWMASDSLWAKPANNTQFFPARIVALSSPAQIDVSFRSTTYDDQAAFGIINAYDTATQQAYATVFCNTQMFDSNLNLIPYGSRPVNKNPEMPDYGEKMCVYICIIDYKNNSIKCYHKFTGSSPIAWNYDYSTPPQRIKTFWECINRFDTSFRMYEGSGDSEAPTTVQGINVRNDYRYNQTNFQSSINSGTELRAEFSYIQTGFFNTNTDSGDFDKFKFCGTMDWTSEKTPNVGHYPCGFFVEKNTIDAKVQKYSHNTRLGTYTQSVQQNQTMTVSVSQPDFVYGTSGQPSPTVSGAPSGASITYQYKPSGGSYSSTVPTAVGTYSVKATVTASGYDTATCETTFSITATTMSVSVSQSDFVYGTSGQPNPTVSGAPSGATITYQYKPASSGSYSNTVPTEAGSYKVKATVSKTGYETATCEITFNITKADNPGALNLNLSMNDYYEMENPKPDPSYNSAALNGGTIAFTYKGRGDTVYAESANKPSTSGTYSVIANVSATQNYNSYQASTSFSVLSSTVHVVVADIPDLTESEAQEYPSDFKPAITGLPNSYTGGYTMRYRPLGSNDSAWQTAFIAGPVGTYEYRPVFDLSSDNYRYNIIYSFADNSFPYGTYRIIEDITYFDVADGSSDFILRSSTYVGNAQAGSTELYLKYNTNTIEQLPIHKEYDNGAMVTVQASVNELQNINVDTLIELHCPYCVDSYIINNDKIIIFTSSADSYATAYEKLQGTPYSLCMVDDNNIAAIKEAMPYNKCVRRVPAGSGNNIINDYSDSFIINLDSEVITNRDMLFGAALRKDGTIEYIDGDERRLLLETPYHTIANYYYPNAKIYYETVKE